VDLSQLVNTPPTTTGIAILTLCTVIVVEVIRARVAAYKAKTIAAKTQVSTARVEHEVTPNHGRSMRDQIDRIVRAVDTLDGKLDDQNVRLARVETIIEIQNGIHKKGT
jgi:hypothetical protein